MKVGFVWKRKLYVLYRREEMIEGEPVKDFREE